jgi:hypothetical protein
MSGLEVIEEHLVKQYSQNVLYLASQEMSKLRGTVINEDVQGEEKFWDQYGTVEMLERTTRFGDSPINITPRESRRLTLFAYETGEPIDSFDTVRMLNDPASPIVRRHSEAVARQFDRTIIENLLGPAVVGRKSPTVVNLPAGHVIAVDNHAYNHETATVTSGNVGLTIGKLLATKAAFGRADVDTPSGGFHIAVTEEQIVDMLRLIPTTSADFNMVKALAQGDINSFMGFNFHVVTPSLLPLSAAGHRRVPVWTPDAAVLGIGQDMRAYVDRRSDKSFNWYTYMELFIGATRVEEAKVVEILCNEP